MDDTPELTEYILREFGGIAANDISHILESNPDDHEPTIINKSFYYMSDNMPLFMKSRDDTFTLLSLNAQSIYAKISKLQLLIQQLNLQNIRVDAIAIQESWLQHDGQHNVSDLTLLHIDGYNILSQGYSCSNNWRSDVLR